MIVFFRFQRTSRIDDSAAEAHAAYRGAKEFALALGMAREVLKPQAMANLRVAAQCTGAAAGSVHERKIESGFFLQRVCVGKTALHSAGVRG